MIPPNPARVRVLDTRFAVREVHTRMPFRYGTAVLLDAPVLHLDVEIHIEGHGRARGVSADMLPPRWFDKDPAKDARRNALDLATGAQAAAAHYRDLTSATAMSPFDLWLAAAPALARSGATRGLNRLTAQHGPSLMDRAILDALGVAEGLGLRELVGRGRTGLRPEAVHPVLAGLDWVSALHPPAPTHLWVRHTVGMGDPLREADIAASDRLHDGLPQSLEAYVRSQGLVYFKIKLGGNPVVDLGRLRAVAGVLDTSIAGAYHVSLDGNEQYTGPERLVELCRAIEQDPAMSRFASSILYVEQPFDRGSPFPEAGVLAPIPYPLVIDEADDEATVFPRALAAGYRGVSSKSCKGLYKSMANALLAVHSNRVAGHPRYFLTGEDLMNTAVVPLHQDTALLGLLGVEHAERNAHHYLAGLGHLSPRERADCLERHPGLYEPWRDGARVAIRGGRMDVRSLQVPGLGVGMPTDFGSLEPLPAWIARQLT